MWTAVILVFAAAVVVLALLTRISVVGESEFWKKLAQVERLRDDAPFDAVFVGHSIPLCAVDPAVVASVSGGLKTYNASLSTLFFGAAQLWLTRSVLPNLRPRFVVLGLAGFELNPHATRMQYMEQYVRAQDLRATFELAHPLKRAVLLCTQLELTKFVIRRLLGRANEPLPLPEDRSVLGPLGDERKHNERTLHTTQRLHEAIRDGIFTDYEHADSEVDKLRSFVHSIRAAGSDVAIMELVMMPNAVDYFPNGQSDYDDAWNSLHALFGELGIAVLTVDRSAFDETCFSDVLHMNGKGKTLYSQQIGAALARLGLEPARS